MMRTKCCCRLFLSTIICALSACSVDAPVLNPSPISPVEESRATLSPETNIGELEKIEVCYSVNTTVSLPLWYAYKNNLFQKYGLDVDILSTGSGTSAATAMIAGEFPICQLAGSAIINAVVAGEDLVYIAEYFNVYLFSLMVSPEIEKAEDLKGKALAITQPGSANDTAIRAALRHLGLKPDIDVSILSIGDEPERLAAMEAGQVAGALFTAPTTLKLREKGYWQLLDLSTIKDAYARQGVATTREYLRSHRTTVVAFMKAISEAIALMKKDSKGTKSILAKYLFLDENTEAAALEAAYQEIIIAYLRERPYPTLASIETGLMEIEPLNPGAASIEPEQVIDETILDELNESGFFDSLYPSQ